MGERRDAVGLHRVKHGDQLFPGRGRGKAGRVKRGLVDPDPVGRVDVDRRGDPLAVAGREALQRGGHDLVPAFGRGGGGQVGKRALIGPVEDVEAQHLHGRRRIAGGDARAQRRHRGLAAAAGDRHVDPADRLAAQVVLEHVQSGGFAARGPPVQDFDILGAGDGGGGEECRRQGRRLQETTHLLSSRLCGGRMPDWRQAGFTQGARVRPIRITSDFTSRNSSRP